MSSESTYGDEYARLYVKVNGTNDFDKVQELMIRCPGDFDIVQDYDDGTYLLRIKSDEIDDVKTNISNQLSNLSNDIQFSDDGYFDDEDATDFDTKIDETSSDSMYYVIPNVLKELEYSYVLWVPDQYVPRTVPTKSKILINKEYATVYHGRTYVEKWYLDGIAKDRKGSIKKFVDDLEICRGI